jgi:nucleotide-binding universal stress UspA family protein
MQREATTQILVYYDSSSEAEHAVDAAAALFPQRRAIVLEVAPTLTFAEGLAAASSSVPGRAFEDLNTADALQRAEAGAEHARSAGLDAVGRAVTASSTWRGIVDTAEEIDAAAIVVGSRGSAGLRGGPGGGLAHEVATHASRPVLIVPPGGRGHEPAAAHAGCSGAGATGQTA